MKRTVLSAICLLLPILGSSALGSNAKLAPLTAAQIIERNLAARGGSSAWQQIRSVTLTGKMDAGEERKDGGAAGTLGTLLDMQRKAIERLQVTSHPAAKADAPKVIQLPFKMDLARSKKMRLEIAVNGETALQLFDGTQGWKLRPFLGRHEVEPYTVEETKTAVSEEELDGPLVNFAAKGTKVSLEGTDVVADRPAYRLRLTLKSGAHRRLWIDGESFLEAKLEGAPRRFNGSSRPVFTYFKNFKKVQGLMMPFTFETAVDGVPRVERILVDHVAFNTPFDAAHFAKPL